MSEPRSKTVGQIASIALSTRKGTRKTPVREAILLQDFGLKGDAHGGRWHRQVSFLASESIEAAKQRGLMVTFGDFAENIATSGIEWGHASVGTKVRIGESAELEITQLGKTCHKKCAIYYMAGDCIMPREGIFARVCKGGTIRCGDSVVLITDKHQKLEESDE